MRWWLAIAFTLCLVAGSVGVFLGTGFDPTVIVVVGTALWAAIDSHAIKLKRYQSGLSYGPIVLFIAVALIWIVGFPWYLIVRHRIKTGRAELKEAATDSAS